MSDTEHKKRWGSDVIPREDWIDVTKKYKTRDGRRVVGLQIKMENSLGEEVTYPVKGAIDNGPRKKMEYAIWTLDGKFSLMAYPNKRDLVLDKEGE